MPNCKSFNFDILSITLELIVSQNDRQNSHRHRLLEVLIHFVGHHIILFHGCIASCLQFLLGFGHAFSQATFPLHCGNRHRFGDGIEQCRDAGEVLFGTLAGFALQLGFGQFDRRTIRRQRKFADITAEIDRRPIRVGLSATRSEQIGEGRTVGTCRRMEVFDNSASMSGLLLCVRKMQIQFREAELPVDLRPRKLEVVFENRTPCFRSVFPQYL